MLAKSLMRFSKGNCTTLLFKVKPFYYETLKSPLAATVFSLAHSLKASRGIFGKRFPDSSLRSVIFGRIQKFSKDEFYSRKCIQVRAASNEPNIQPSEKSKALSRENLYTIPNMLTFSRIATSPLIGYWIVTGNLNAAFGLFVASGVTDMLDGYIARNYNMQSIVGSILDPLADKILMTVLVVSLSWVSFIPAPLAYLILGRDGGLILASFYYRYISLPPPKTMVRYWDFTIPSAEVRPTLISKANTFLQLGLVGSTLLGASLGVPTHPILTGLQYTVAATTLGSGLSYVFSKDAVRILNQPKKV
ncbi:hypothetical protein DSO57_1015944 [Entomophthora muscae]|uniref:Uncharacterized protein n=1 Tax=Entomophthora muscae TaxID=34485 RepID=A0ACC2SHP4_9FUNG|nr:hypothetical protein DSO57_1015944 [Entomophthora muscae]